MSAHDAPPGGPGIEPRWTSSAKSGVGTAVSRHSRVWFTLSHGIVNEVYYPRVDRANIRDLGLLATGPDGFFSEEKRDASHEVEPLGPGVPAYRLTNQCTHQRYRIIKNVFTDPERDVLLQSVRFEPLAGDLGDYRLFVLLAPHIGNQGYGNHGWVGESGDANLLCAARGDVALALACSHPFGDMSCSYVGPEDAWHDIKRHGYLTELYEDAPDGNLALAAELPLVPSEGRLTLSLGFGNTPDEAGENALASLLIPFDEVMAEYVRGWTAYQEDWPGAPDDSVDLYRVSTAVLKTHEDKTHAGATIASLSVPWGIARGDHDLGGYHLVWPRDLVETAGSLLAAGRAGAARDALMFLASTQEDDGHWPQNMWLDGNPYWNGIQLDETGFPILLADMLRRHGALDGLAPWLMIRRAATYLALTGPVTPQDRWEEDGGYSPFTLAVTVAALLAAADFADEAGEARAAEYLRDTADSWYDGIDRWTYVTDSDLARRLGVEGYYARIAPPEVADGASPASGFVPVKNRPVDHSRAPYGEIVSADALALVRFCLRDANDPRILNTVQVIDALLRTETSTGPAWHRYNEDGYGEHEDGAPFDGTGVGRGWPLLTGERAHYELAAGHLDAARALLGVMGAQASPEGFIPEQVWDAPDLPERELHNGHPSGSAMPLVWAHAEYVKLVRSLADRRVFDAPPQPAARYLVEPRESRLSVWRFNNKIRTMPPGRMLRVDLRSPAAVRWSMDGWTTVHDTETIDTGLGAHYADLPSDTAPEGSRVQFTFRWTEGGQWEGSDFEVTVEAV